MSVGSTANTYFNPVSRAGIAMNRVDSIAGSTPLPDAPHYDPNAQNFQYGLGRSDSYASQQSRSYDDQQARLQALAGDAYNRQAPTQAMPQSIQFQQSDGQGYLNGAGADARRQQLAALGGLTQSNQALGQFAQRGSQASRGVIQQAADLGARQQMGMARAQPGGGGAALRGAAFNAAGIMNNAGNTAAIASQQDRAQSLAALQGVQSGQGALAGYAGQLRGADIGLAQTQAGQANYDAGASNAFSQGQQQLQFNVGQNNLNANLQSRQQSDAFALGALDQSRQYEGLRNDVASGNAQAGYNLESARAQGAGLGVQTYNTGIENSNRRQDRNTGMVAAALGAISDVRAKKDIKPADGIGGFFHRLGAGYLGTSAAPARKSTGPTDAVSSPSGDGAPSSDGYVGEKGPHGYSQEQAKKLYYGQLHNEGSIGAQFANAHDTNARQDVDFNQDEFRTPGTAGRIGLGSAGDARQARLSQLAALGGGAPDLRPAQGYEYAYKDPEAHGQGRYVGPMAQDLEHLPGVVEQDSNGTKSINAPRLTLANTAAVSEQQRRIDRLEQLAALGGGSPPPDYGQFPAPELRPPNYAALDQASGWR